MIYCPLFKDEKNFLHSVFAYSLKHQINDLLPLFLYGNLLTLAWTFVDLRLPLSFLMD